MTDKHERNAVTDERERPAQAEQPGSGGFEEGQQQLPDDENVGRFSEGVETLPHDDKAAQFSEGGETLPDDEREGKFSDSVDADDV